MDLAIAPDFEDVDANDPGFRQDLAAAGTVLAETDVPFGAYSRHSHKRAVVIRPGQVLFEQLMANGTLKLFPLDLAEARRRGKPSCWVFTPGEDGRPEVHELRYADTRLHIRSEVDVTTGAFESELYGVAATFVAEDIHRRLELNLATSLFAPPPGHLTRERTFAATGNEVTGHHIVDFVPTPPAILEGDWSEAACWSFPGKQPVVTGWCWSDSVQGVNHRQK